LKKNKNILVTGGTGLVGAHLLVQLAKSENQIYALYRTSSGLEKTKHVFSYYSTDFENLFSKIKWVKGDITDIPSLEKAFDDIDWVYHCAAIVSFSRKDENLMRKTNIEGTANMVNLALANDVKKFCYVSSIATLDKNKKTTPIDETNEWNPENNNYDYAISKYGGEMEVWRASQEGLDVIIVHPGVILGSGFWHINTGKFFANAANNFLYYTTGITGFVGVKEVVKTMILLMESSIVNDHFILVSENRSFQYIMTEIAQALGTKPPTKKVSPLLGNIAWRLAWIKAKLTGKPPLITKHSANAAQQVYYYSSEKIQKALHFSFPSINQSIQDYSEHYKSDYN
jgi:nucleoside-diphosphate-sugar epimerase